MSTEHLERLHVGIAAPLQPARSPTWQLDPGRRLIPDYQPSTGNMVSVFDDQAYARGFVSKLETLLINWVVLLSCFSLADVADAYYPRDFSRPLDRIAIGSCNRQKHAQPHWQTLQSLNPDLWIWLGDNVYADTEDMAKMRHVYRTQFQRPDYAAFRRETPVIGTWDDYDYGDNNSGNWFPKKRQSQQLLLDFLEEPADSPRRTREGVYARYTFGPPGRRVDVVLLDNRYHADRPGEEADILGEAQWRFLEEALATSEAQFIFVGSGTQFLALDHPYENWGNFPHSRRRLLRTVQLSGKGGIVLLSGDRHIHEVSMLNDGTVPYPLIDFTASGLTHSFRRLTAEANRYRVGALYKQPGFGLVEIDWEREDPRLSLQVLDREGGVHRRFEITLSSLQPHKDLDD